MWIGSTKASAGTNQADSAASHGLNAKLAQAMARALFEKGVYVSGFFFPVVPKGQARIRTQMSAALTKADLDAALDSFEEAGRECGVLK